MADAILALNAGSSSIKFALFRASQSADLVPVVRGLIDDGAPSSRLDVKSAGGEALEGRAWPAGTADTTVLSGTIEWIEQHLGADRLVGVGHRIVHGGRDFCDPVRLDPDTLANIEALTPLAPLHQPRSLAPARALRDLRPDLPQVGCFDTAFHHALAPPVSRYAIPRALEAAGLRKYGFHGLSYEYVSQHLAALDPTFAGKRTIVAHLGNGASLCAMRHGRSHDTTMGFTALDGLVMGTRPGTLDPGLLLHLQRVRGLSPDAVEDLLYHRCGLLGVSQISGDVRVLSESRDPRAREALDLFGFRLAAETAALACTLEGLEVLVFTGGIGEHAAEVRADACRRLAWLGVSMDAAANAHHAAVISAPSSRVQVRVLATDEERVIAGHTHRLLGTEAPSVQRERKVMPPSV